MINGKKLKRIKNRLGGAVAKECDNKSSHTPSFGTTEQMSPEELAAYITSRCESWSESVASGKATSEDQGIVAEMQAIIDKHVKTMEKDGYVKFHQNLSREVCHSLLYELAEGRLRILDQRITSTELSIATHIQKDALLEMMIRKEGLPEEETVDRIRKMHRDTQGEIRALYTELRNLEKERDVYLAQPVWKKYKGTPVVKKRTPLLKKTAVLKYIF